jgi:hypothetical protein
LKKFQFYTKVLLFKLSEKTTVWCAIMIIQVITIVTTRTKVGIVVPLVLIITVALIVNLMMYSALIKIQTETLSFHTALSSKRKHVENMEIIYKFKKELN